MNDNFNKQYVTVRDMYDKKNTTFIQRIGVLRFALLLGVAVVILACIILSIVIAVKKRNSNNLNDDITQVSDVAGYSSVFDYSLGFLDTAYSYGFSGILSGCNLAAYVPDELKPCVEQLSECYVEGLVSPYSVDIYIYEGISEGSPLITSLKITEDGYYWNLSCVCEFAEQTKDIPDVYSRFSKKVDNAAYVYYDIKELRSGDDITAILKAILLASQDSAEISSDNGLLSMKISGLNYDGMVDSYLRDILSASDGSLYFAVSADAAVPYRSGKLYAQTSTFTFQGEYYEVATVSEKPDVYYITWEEYNDAIVGVVNDYQAEVQAKQEEEERLRQEQENQSSEGVSNSEEASGGMPEEQH